MDGKLEDDIWQQHIIDLGAYGDKQIFPKLIFFFVD